MTIYAALIGETSRIIRGGVLLRLWSRSRSWKLWFGDCSPEECRPLLLPGTRAF